RLCRDCRSDPAKIAGSAWSWRDYGFALGAAVCHDAFGSFSTFETAIGCGSCERANRRSATILSAERQAAQVGSRLGRPIRTLVERKDVRLARTFGQASNMSNIVLNTVYPQPPERVWRALTTPEELAQWLMPNDFAPKVGHKFQF